MKRKNSYLSTCLSNDSEKVRSGVGKNIIPPPEKEPLWKLYLEKFKDPIVIVLLAVFVLSIGIAFYEVISMGKSLSVFIEPSGVLVALLLSTIIGFIFEQKANNEFQLLNHLKNHIFVREAEICDIQWEILSRNTLLAHIQQLDSALCIIDLEHLLGSIHKHISL